MKHASYFPRHADFFSSEPNRAGCIDHNDIVTSWEEAYRFADGRRFMLRGPATTEEYIEQQLLKVS